MDDSLGELALALLLHVFDELYQHFRVGLALKVEAFLLQLRTEDVKVFYDSIVHEGEIARLREVGMGIGHRGFAMSGPAGVGDAEVSGQILASSHSLQVGHLARGLVDIQVLTVQQSHSGRVVTTILKPVKSFNQYGISLSASNISNYSTHTDILILFVYDQE